MKKTITAVIAAWACLLLPAISNAQNEHDSKSDSIYIHEIEKRKTPVKVLHAEPLYIDLIRDLGARKGEKEWNIGMGITDNNVNDEYSMLIEYEWAPADRLGLEVELPFSFYSKNNSSENKAGRLNGLKVAGQYSFLVSEKKTNQPGHWLYS